MPADVQSEEKYSTVTGLVYVFNLIVGTGALALPGAVSKAGWLFGILMVSLLGLISLVTVTFILESIAVVNAVVRAKKYRGNLEAEPEDLQDEDTPLVVGQEMQEADQMYDITDKYEIGEMGTVLLSKPTKLLTFCCLVVYLFGDLSIYCAVVAKTLTHVICSDRLENITCNNTVPDYTPCLPTHNFSRTAAYQTFVCVFVLLLGPFAYFNVQKTKVLQILTSCMRWIAFLIMIIWSIQKLVVFGPQGSPPLANFHALPALFGTCVYSFMCQHSVPSLIQPMSDKMNLKKSFSLDYLIITLFYLLLAMTAIFTFSRVEDLYTLNFWSDTCNNQISSSILFLDYYLALFPVFTLSTSFPIIAITLRNNMRSIFLKENVNYNFFLDKLLFPTIAVVVPAIMALSISDIQKLVGVIGSYAGAGVQYLIPCILVVAARSKASKFPSKNPYVSPFSAKFWVVGIYVWMVLCLVLISIYYSM